ncbi:MobH family relaxase [Salinisphaera orenii]|uniref:MobH family relaxase n=1 Tax=Salinisphaera orenii TaxID=856731 RepID=UPI0013A61A73
MLARLRNPFRNNRSKAESAPDDSLAVLPASELMLPYRGELRAIRTRLGVPPDAWDTLYHPLFNQYAGLVQRLPASEAHHHAGAGGLLQHGLEVVRHALDLKQGIVLPPRAAPESQAKRQDLWVYACVTAALLHDLGKIVTDQTAFYTLPGESRLSPWSPLAGPMPSGATYRLRFNRGRRYHDHERIPPLLAHHLIPSDGMAWLASDSEALARWLATIQADTASGGPLGEIVAQADGLSVSRNLSGGALTQMPAAQAKPLTTRLMTGLRHLLDNGQLSLNQRGAAAFLASDTLWLVSKTALDALRVHLIEESQSGVPTRNDRLMDELQQHGILIPNGERAIWRCRIRIGDWQQELTCLRIPAAQVWSRPDARPESLDGSVEPGPSDETEPDTDTTDQATDKPVTNTQPASIDKEDELPLPLDPTTSSPGETRTKTEEDSTEDSASSDPPKGDDNETTSAAGYLANADDAGERFVAWLIESINAGSIAINTPEARAHTIPEGLALVSPGIFRDFDSDRWSHVQKRFQKLGLHRKTAGERNIWQCKAAGPRHQAILNVMLLPDPFTKLGLSVTKPNNAVSLLNDSAEISRKDSGS